MERDYPGEPPDAVPHPPDRRAIARAAALTDSAPRIVGIISGVTLLLGAGAVAGRLAERTRCRARPRDGAPAVVDGAAETAQALGSWLIGFGFILFVTWGRRAYRDPSARRTIGILWDVGTFWPRAAHPFAPPCYAERAVPDLTWRMATWTERHRRPARHLRPLPGQRAGGGRRLAAGAAGTRRRVALLTYGSPLERLYGRWFPAYFGPAALQRAAPRGATAGAICGGSPTPSAARSGCPARAATRGGPRAAQGPAGLRPYPRASAARADPRPRRLPGRPGLRRGAGRRAARPGSGPARAGPAGRPADDGAGRDAEAPRPALRAARAGPPGRAGSGRRCSARRAGRPGPRAARPSPRTSAARCGRCRTRAPWAAP